MGTSIRDVIKNGFYDPNPGELYDIYQSEEVLMKQMKQFIQTIKVMK